MFKARKILIKMSAFSTCSIKTNIIPSLVEADFVATLLERQNNIKFLDASWHMNKNRNALAEFEHERIPGAQFFDIDEISDHSSSLPHMVPTELEFSKYISSKGISNSDHIIIYGMPGTFSSSRVWWTFRLFGHTNVSILNGGFASWKDNGGKVETELAKPLEGAFTAKLNPNYVSSWQQVLSIVNNGSAQILDARSQARFLAQAPEPRVGLQGGHIPGSLCIPFTSILQLEDTTRFRTPNEIKNVFMDAGIILGSKVVFTCGSGVTASVLYFALHLLGIDMENLSVYDGSWTEWGARPDLPKIVVALDSTSK